MLLLLLIIAPGAAVRTGDDGRAASCPDGVIFSSSLGPCLGYSTATAVRQHLWEAWEQCAGTGGAAAVTFNATGYGQSGQLVSVALAFRDYWDPLRLTPGPLPGPAASGSLWGSLREEGVELPKDLYLPMDAVEEVGGGSFHLSGKGSLVAASGNANEGEAAVFLWRLAACATLSWYDMLPRRGAPRANIVANKDLWTYGVDDGRGRGMGKKAVPAELAPAVVAGRPMLDIALRALPASQRSLPTWLWGGDGSAGWPPALRLGHYIGRYEEQCPMGCRAYMMGLEGKSEGGGPLGVALYGSLMDLKSAGSGTLPRVILARGAGKDRELFSVGLTSAARDHGGTQSGEKSRWVIVGDEVLMQLPEGRAEIVPCTAVVHVNLAARYVAISLESNAGHSSELATRVCNLKEAIRSEMLTTFDLFVWK